MKTGLKKREKILLFTAFVVGVVSLTVTYVIMPMYATLGRQQELHDTLRTERMQLELKFSNEELYLQANADAHLAYADIERRYPAVMPNNEIDNILTGLCMDYHLRPTSLSLSDAARKTEWPAFSAVTASMALNGTYESLLSLIDEVRRHDYIRITSVRFSQPREVRQGIDIPTIGITFEVTMLNPVETAGQIE